MHIPTHTALPLHTLHHGWRARRELPRQGWRATPQGKCRDADTGGRGKGRLWQH